MMMILLLLSLLRSNSFPTGSEYVCVICVPLVVDLQ